jgi:hypothetical protein
MVVHVAFCLHILNKYELLSLSLEDHLTLLLALNMLVLLYVLLVRVKGAERRLGLLGGFILGITPLGLAGLGFATSLASVREALKENPTPVDLSPYHKRAPGKIRVVVGVDTSRSVLQRDQEAAEAVCKLAGKMLASQDEWDAAAETPLPSILEPVVDQEERRELVEMAFYEFDTEVRRVQGIGERRFSDPWPKQLRDEICDRVKQLSQTRNPSSQKTDIIAFLEKVEVEALPALEMGERVVVIIVSDFLHDPSERQNRQRIEAAIRKFSGQMKKAHHEGRRSCSEIPEENQGEDAPLQSEIQCSKLAVVAFAIPSLEKPVPASRDDEPVIDVRSLLAGELSGYWQEHILKNILNAGSPQDLLLLTGVLSTEIRVEVKETLYLRYHTDFIEVPGTDLANMLSPDDVGSGKPNLLAFKLRCWPDRGSLPGEININFKMSSNGVVPISDETEQTLNSSNEGNGNWNYAFIPGGLNEKVSLRIASPLDLSRGARLQLLVAVPGSLIVYAVPVIVFPGPGEQAVLVFRLTVYFFLWSVVAFCITHFWSWARANWPASGIKGKIWSGFGWCYESFGRFCLGASQRLTKFLSDRFGAKNGFES